MDEIEEYIQQVDLPSLGQTLLYDGETGDRFHQASNGWGNLYVEIITHGR